MTVLLALVASFVYGAADFVGAVASRRAPPLWVAGLAQLTAFFLLLPMAALASGARITANDAEWSLASGVAVACGLGLFYSAMAGGLISLVVPITAVVSAVAPVVYALAHGEHPSAVTLVGIVLALAAIAVVSSMPGSGQKASPAIIVRSIASGIFFGAFIVLVSRASERAGLWPIVFSRSTSALGLAVLALVHTGRPPSGIGRILPACSLIGMLEAAGGIVLILAIYHGPLAVMSVLISLYPVTTVLLAMVFLGERLSRHQFAGVALALGSVILISVQ